MRMKWLGKAAFLFWFPVAAIALSISIGIAHTASLTDRTDRALNDIGLWQNMNGAIPWGTTLTLVWSDNWTELAHYYYQEGVGHVLQLFPLSQRHPAGGAYNPGATGDCVPYVQVTGHYFSTTVKQGENVGTPTIEWLGDSYRLVGCGF